MARLIKSRSSAFTLIEVLVVMAIVGTLVALLVPALGKCRAAAKRTRELNTARQAITALHSYSNDSRGDILPGYAKQSWVNGRMEVRNNVGERIYNEDAQRFPWRLVHEFGGDFRGLYDQSKVLADIAEREAEYAAFGVNFDYVVSLFPSLGMNVNFVGGNDRNQMFDPLFQRVYGRAHLARMDQAVRPSGVIAFASAKAEPQPAVPILGQPEGFFRVESPVFGVSTGRRWGVEAYNATSVTPGQNSGFVSFRHGGKAIGAHLDGHAEALGWDDMRDMRRWADQAATADWGLEPRS